MSGMTAQGSTDFQRRCAEMIEARNAAAQARPKRRKRAKRRSAAPSKYRLRVGHLQAFLLGAAAILLARVLRFYIADAPMLDHSTELYWVIDLATAMLVSYIACKLFWWKIQRVMLWHMLGGAVMLVSMHNLVHRFPAEAMTLFSAPYVEAVLSGTTPNSLIFRGLVVDKNGVYDITAGRSGSGSGAALLGCSSDAFGVLAAGDLAEGLRALQEACF